jgi:NitT/TauT family transport system substrate-binding protein
MKFDRRAVLRSAAGLGASTIGRPISAQARRTLKVNIVANTLGIHIPYMGALNEILPGLGYERPNIDRISRLETITQAVLSGSAEVGTGDAISTLRAVEAGADLRIIGNCFMNTSLVFVANAATVRTDKELEKSGVTVAVNSLGDFTHVMLIHPLRKRGIDLNKVNVISMGGSGTRLRALIAGRVDAVPLHFDQVQELVATGKYRILIEPWVEFDNFLGETWMVSSTWLAKPDNRRAAVDLIKAVIVSFRRAHVDAPWFAAAYRKYGTDSAMARQSDARIDEIRIKLADTVHAWPADMHHSPAIYRELMPIYREAGAVAGSVDIDKTVDTSVATEALRELGPG